MESTLTDNLTLTDNPTFTDDPTSEVSPLAIILPAALVLGCAYFVFRYVKRNHPSLYQLTQYQYAEDDNQEYHQLQYEQN